jgi:hypothetical protein
LLQDIIRIVDKRCRSWRDIARNVSTTAPVRGIRGSGPMPIKLSGFPLCKAGDWGLQPPEKRVFVVFFCGFAAKKPKQKGVWGCAPMGNMR